MNINISQTVASSGISTFIAAALQASGVGPNWLFGCAGICLVIWLLSIANRNAHKKEAIGNLHVREDIHSRRPRRSIRGLFSLLLIGAIVAIMVVITAMAVAVVGEMLWYEYPWMVPSREVVLYGAVALLAIMVAPLMLNQVRLRWRR